ncbi:uncharacterized protein UDID_17481 [Ustilago sp. UG-2017a]|nr:uncharacterized protein UDID_17481 [Ustilago sp. UG-2017a]
MNRSLGEKMRTLLIQRNLPKSFWPYTIWAAAFKMNLTPNVDREFPYQLMFRKSPEHFICLMHVFGCLAWVNVPKAKRHNKKLDQRAVPAIFIGYSLERKGWLFYSPDYSPNIFWSNSGGVHGNSMLVRPNRMEASEHSTASNNLERRGTQGAKVRSTDFFGLVTTGLKKKERNLKPTIREALAGEDKRFWEEAMHKELKGLEAMNTWETTNLPRDTNTVDTRWVLKIKTDANLIPTKYKARLVALGFTQREGIDYKEIFAPVAPIQSIRGVLAIAAVRGWEVDSINVKQAYLNSSLHHDVYLKPPIGMKVPPGKVLKLMKGLYGLKQSGCKGTDNQLMVIAAYVDDMLIASPSRKEVDRTKAEIMGKWETEDNGPVKEFLGIKIMRDRSQSKISLDLTAYIKGMVSKWLEKPNEKSWIPMQSIANTVRGSKCTSEWAKQYQELVGQLLWVSNMVRPDISFTVGVLVRHMSEPINSTWQAAIHLLKYLNQTSKYHLELGGTHRKHAKQPVVMYTDANWASDPTNGRRSTSGAVTYVYGCPVSWESHIQKCVALSAVEAVLVAASEAVREALFFSYLLRDLGITEVRPVLYTDSQGCIQVSKGPAKHWKLKHIDPRYYFIRDHVQDSDISIEFVGTANNMANILTKPLKGLNTTRI